MAAAEDLRSQLDALTKALDAAGVPYAVCGALALAIHGHPRATQDLDVLTPHDQIAPLKVVARGLGFTLEALPITFSGSGITVHRVNRISAGKLLTLDILDASGALAPVWETREQVATERGSLWVVSRQGLVTMKLAAGRPQDLADLVALEGSS
ncbi:MAG: hypothetical protein SFX73_02975 [Kofleriaceae bacterium]|nr:hypothetical protein [Kofleriaceae bacterium]